MTIKAPWQTTAELRLQQLEARATATREAAQALYNGELLPIQATLRRLAERIKKLNDWRPASQPHGNSDPQKAAQDVAAELDAALAEREQITAAIAEIKVRHDAASAAARVANQHAERARQAYRMAAGVATQFNARDGFTASAGSVGA